ncbi:MAG: hypothetical protein ACLQAL_06145 [Halobacteriota archaeon]|jgi:hypothetical protein
MNPNRKKGGERKVIMPKSIRFVKSCGSYKTGDDLKLDSADAATFVAAGYAVYREDDREGE